MADVAGVSMEHEHGGGYGLLYRSSYEECAQLLAIWCWDEELLIVVEAVGGGAGDVCACVGGDVRGVDE